LSEPSNWKIYDADQLAILRLGAEISEDAYSLQEQTFAAVRIFALLFRKSLLLSAEAR
jgi:hypothetical protein